MNVVNSRMNREPINYDYSIGMWKYHYILNEIFKTINVSFEIIGINDFTNSRNPKDPNAISGFDNYVKNQLDLGNPVMLHICKYNEETGNYDNYHSVVAYYYDEYGIHAHFGWNDDSTDIVINDEYQITHAGIMDTTNIPYVHSNNYIIQNEYFCGCGQIYTHQHDFSYSVIEDDENYHLAYCSCLYSFKQLHTILIDQCTKCGIAHEHSYNFSCLYHNSSYHRVYCSCGDYKLKYHRSSAITGRCIDCNALVTPNILLKIKKEEEN